MNDKTVIITMFMMLFIVVMIPSVSALKYYDEDSRTYSVYDWLVLKKYDIKLLEVDDSISEANAYGDLYVYKEAKVFKDLYYKDIVGNNQHFKESKGEGFKFYINETNMYYRVIDKAEELVNCSTSENGTLYDCDANILNWTYEPYYIEEWKEVNVSEKIPEGHYKWLILSDKPFNSRVDFVITTAEDGNLTEWAWWNSTFLYKQQIDNLTGEYPTFNVTYDVDMQTDFDDIRFISTEEDIELNYTLRVKTDNVSAMYTVDVNGNSTIYMYFGNGGVTTTASVNDTFHYPVFMVTWDDSDNDLITGGAGTPTNSPTKINGFIGSAYYCDDATTEYIRFGDLAKQNAGGDMTVHAVINANDINSVDYIIGKDGVSPRGWAFGMFEANASAKRYTGEVGGAGATGSWSFDIVENQWFKSTFIFRDAANTLNTYINDTSKDNMTLTGALNVVSYNLDICQRSYPGSAQSYDGNVDDVIVYDRAISLDFLTELNTMSYQSPTIGNKTTSGTLAVNLIQPEDNYLSNNGSVFFNCTCTDDTGCLYLNMTVDGVQVNTTTGGGSSNLTVTYTNNSVPDGSYTWYCSGGSALNDLNSSVYTFSVDTTAPVISIDAPTTIFDVIYEDLVIDLNYSVTESNFGFKSYYYNDTFNATLNDTTAETLTAGTKAYYFLNDSIGGTTGDVTFNYDFGGNFHSLSTAVLNNLATWTSAQSNPDCYGLSYTSPTVSFNGNLGNYVCVTLNDGTELIMNITGNNSFEWDYNRVYLPQGVNSTVSYNPSNYNITLYAKDTFNNTAEAVANITRKSEITDEGYPVTVVEGSTNTFYLTVDVNSSYNLETAYLVYNDTFYEATQNIAGTVYNISYALNIPSVTADENVTFFWQYNLNDTTQVNYTEHNVTVQNLNIDDCSTYNYTLFNLTLLEERNQASLVGNIYVDIDIYTQDRTINVIEYSNNFTSVNNATICLESDLGDSTFSMDTLIQYNANQFATELYHYYDFALTNASLPQEVSLYDLNNSVSTEFLITYKDEAFLPVDKALINIQRKYIGEGVFKVVELPLTDQFGQTVGHFDTEQGVYTVVVTKGGQTLATFSEITVICQDALLGECNLNLNSLSSSTDLGDWNSYDGVTFQTSFDPSTRTVSKTFASTDGSVKRVTLTSYKSDAYLTTLICNDTLNSASGTLTCNVPNSFGNISIVTSTYVGGDLVSRESYKVDADPRDIFGDDGYIFVIMLMLTIPMMFVSSGVGVVVGAIMGLLIAGALNLFTLGSVFGVASSITWLIIAGGIIIWKISQRE